MRYGDRVPGQRAPSPAASSRDWLELARRRRRRAGRRDPRRSAATRRPIGAGAARERPARLLRGAHRAGAGARGARRSGRRRHRDRRPDARRGSTFTRRGRPRRHRADDRRAATRSPPRRSGCVAVEALARGAPGLVATVGRARRRAGREQRHPRRGAAARSTCATPTTPCAARRSPTCARRRERRSPRARERRAAVGRRAGETAVACDLAALTERLAAAVAAAGCAPSALPSGAGHDGVVMARRRAVAMLFVRCERRHQPQPGRGGRGGRRRGRARRARALRRPSSRDERST